MGKDLNRYTIGWPVFAVLFGGLIYIAFTILRQDYDWEAIRPYMGNIFVGWRNTVLISLVALVLSVVVGIFLTIGQLVPFKPAQIMARGYVEFVRGMPLLVLILMGFYIIADSLKLDNKFVFGVILISLFSGTYLSEIFRAGVESIASSQLLSARALGLDSVQTYLYVIIPQAIKRVLPASAGQFANLIKDTSLLYVIAVQEITMAVRETNARAYTDFEPYIPLAIGYLVLTLPIFFWSRHLERKFGFDQ